MNFVPKSKATDFIIPSAIGNYKVILVVYTSDRNKNTFEIYTKMFLNLITLFEEIVPAVFVHYLV